MSITVPHLEFPASESVRNAGPVMSVSVNITLQLRTDTEKKN